MRKRVAEDKRSTATPVPEPKPAKRGFLGANGYELVLASLDDRIYAELDRESREQAEAEAKQADRDALSRALAATIASAATVVTREAPAPTPPSVLMSAEEAAHHYGISVKALYARASRYQVPGRMPGRRLQFHREKFLAGLAKSAR